MNTNLIVDSAGCICEYIVPIYLFGLIGALAAFVLYCGIKIMRMSRPSRTPVTIRKDNEHDCKY